MGVVPCGKRKQGVKRDSQRKCYDRAEEEEDCELEQAAFDSVTLSSDRQRVFTRGCKGIYSLLCALGVSVLRFLKFTPRRGA